jgi:hypothetical protein
MTFVCFSKIVSEFNILKSINHLLLRTYPLRFRSFQTKAFQWVENFQNCFNDLNDIISFGFICWRKVSSTWYAWFDAMNLCFFKWVFFDTILSMHFLWCKYLIFLKLFTKCHILLPTRLARIVNIALQILMFSWPKSDRLQVRKENKRIWRLSQQKPETVQKIINTQ